MNSVVTERFMMCIATLKSQNKVKSMRQFALSLDYLPQGLSEMANGRRDVTIELVRKAIEKYDFNSEFIFTGIGTKLRNAKQDDLRILTVVTDSSNSEYIVHVPVAAQAGYIDQFNDPSFVKELPAYNLPYENIRGGSYRSFDIEGTSMEPTLQHSDKVVCSFIEPQYWEHAIKNGQVYVVLTDDGIVVKRLINNIRSNRMLDLVSDNNTYDIVKLPVTQVREVWWVRLKISPYLDKPATQDMNLKVQLEHQNRMIEQLSNTVSQLASRRSA
jgi:phage repressor protein C with HTH and peptisase S24 domain